MTDHDGKTAAEALLAEHLPALLAFVRLHSGPLIRDNESCSDIVQSVCREVLEDLGSFEFRGVVAFRNWLFAQAMGKLADRRRHYLAQKRDVRRHRPLRPCETRSQMEALYASLCSPSAEAIAHETVERLERAFDQLPVQYQEIITLSRLAGMSHAEIAAKLGRNEVAVRTLLHRALSRLGRLMDDPDAVD